MPRTIYSLDSTLAKTSTSRSEKGWNVLCGTSEAAYLSPCRRHAEINAQCSEAVIQDMFTDQRLWMISPGSEECSSLRANGRVGRNKALVGRPLLGSRVSEACALVVILCDLSEGMDPAPSKSGDLLQAEVGLARTYSGVVLARDESNTIKAVRRIINGRILDLRLKLTFSCFSHNAVHTERPQCPRDGRIEVSHYISPLVRFCDSSRVSTEVVATRLDGGYRYAEKD